MEEKISSTAETEEGAESTSNVVEIACALYIERMDEMFDKHRNPLPKEKLKANHKELVKELNDLFSKQQSERDNEAMRRALDVQFRQYNEWNNKRATEESDASSDSEDTERDRDTQWRRSMAEGGSDSVRLSKGLTYMDEGASCKFDAFERQRTPYKAETEDGSESTFNVVDIACVIYIDRMEEMFDIHRGPLPKEKLKANHEELVKELSVSDLFFKQQSEMDNGAIQLRMRKALDVQFKEYDERNNKRAIAARDTSPDSESDAHQYREDDFGRARERERERDTADSQDTESSRYIRWRRSNAGNNNGLMRLSKVLMYVGEGASILGTVYTPAKVVAIAAKWGARIARNHADGET